MSTFALVHGAWHGAWCWEQLTPLLEQEGHSVIAPDLPGHGKDQTPPAEITLQSYVDCVADALDEAGEPVILIGHSMAGTVISQLAEQRPEQIATLVYLAAFLLPDGESLFGAVRWDTESKIVPNLIPNETEGHMWIRDEVIPEVFYDDCSSEHAKEAVALLCPEPLAPPMTPLQLSDDRYGRVPRIYILCTEDKAVSPAFQRHMIAGISCDQVIEMDTGHSPFVSQPEMLARHLLDIAARAPVAT